MIINRDKRLLKPFRLAKSMPKEPSADLRHDYRRRLELGLILSLILAIVSIVSFPRLHKKHTETVYLTDSFTALDITALKLEEVRPKVKTRILPQIIEKPEPEPPPKVRKRMAEPPRLKTEERHRDAEVAPELDLDMADLSSTPDAGSSIDELSEMRSHSARDHDHGLTRLALNVSDGASAFGLSTGGDLLLDDSFAGKARVQETEAPKIDLGTSLPLPASNGRTPSAKPPAAPAKPRQNGLFGNAETKMLLRSSESSIALAEARLWNKLNAELDRLYKGRYGDLGKSVRRSRSGLDVALAFSDGVSHHVRWRGGGRTEISVSGPAPKSPKEELQRAISALIQMTLR